MHDKYIASQLQIHCNSLIGAALSRHQGIQENIAIKQLFQRTSLTLMRGNAAMIVSRRPDSDLAQPEVDGIQ